MPRTKDWKFIKDRFNNNRRYGLKLTLALNTILLAILLFVLIVASASIRGTMYYYENEIHSLLNGVVGAKLTLVMIKFIECFDKYLVWGIPGALFIFLVLKKDWWSILALFLSVGGGAVLISYLKKAFHRWSPVLHIMERGGDPFPSGHAFYTMLVFGLMIYVAWEFLESNRLKALILSLCTMATLLMGISLISLDHHWIAEVLGGYCAGYSWLLISILLIRTIRYFWKAEGGTLRS